MKRYICTAFSAFIAISATAQQTKAINDPQIAFKEAKEYFQKEYYSLAYPIFKELDVKLTHPDRTDKALEYLEVKYYTIVCGLKQDEPMSSDMAKSYISANNNTTRGEMMAYHLAEYFFRQKDYANAVTYYNMANIDALSNREIADMKFHKAYSLFNLQKFDEAKPLFDAIRQMPKDPNYLDANYYYSFILFNEGKYKESLDGFKKVEDAPNYKKIVPYYIATIYYNTGQKDQALTYAEAKLKKGDQYYDAEFKQLIGHAYFEKGEFAKALPYLEAFVSKSKQVSRRDLYELSYCYYNAGTYAKAIDGFKQLGGKEDSLAQNAMYLLGDAYLKTNQKANARNAFLFCSNNSSNVKQKEISQFNYGKLSYELGYQDVAQSELASFIQNYPNSAYNNEARELMVALMANTNNFKDALTLLESIKTPSETVQRLYPRVLYGRAMEFVNDGMLIAANDLLDKALRAKFNESVLPLVNFWKGEISFRLDKTDDAVLYYNNYLKTPVTSGDVKPVSANYNLGYCYFKKENYKQALSYFDQVVKTPRISSSPVEQDAFIREADCYYMARDYKKAVGMYDQVVGFSWPASDYATFQKAMVAGVNSSNDKIKLLQSIERVYKNSSLAPDANMEIAGTYMADEKFSDAIPFLKKVVSSNTDNEALKPKALLKLGIAYYNIDNNTEALNQYNAILKQYPNSPEADEAIDNAKSIYVEEGKTADYVAFAKSMGRTISVNQEDSLAYAEAEVQFSNGNFNGALNKFDNYLSRFPDGHYAIEAYYYRSEIYNNKKDYANAVKGYEAVSDRVPNKFGEKSLVQAARINFFDVKNYDKAEQYFSKLKDFATTQENKLEAMRGLLRSQYQLKKWSEAVANAKDLVAQKSSSSDDKVLSNMVLAKSAQGNNDLDLAISYYRNAIALNKGEYAAEARYEIAGMLVKQNKLKEGEKAAFEVINKSGSYELWVTKSYILLGDIYYSEKDYFNAKATYQSVIDNSSNPDLKEQAQQKLTAATDEEKQNSKLKG
ncbi:tetratricopeptide repeat protein [Pinibacter aurantiacus]|uniref:Tetratricopeptide repeat protein n=1 Tax=Pinibacter aurantiacus TaxID=2851599 RepID=A0A9E2S8Z2_9BACT|nr:tetratricopeptide repeat protein [Pinibacter aurantiacus]MBV4355540.1 tetratricopeptide repeat protein [Pinibacter aurantiacus]